MNKEFKDTIKNILGERQIVLFGTGRIARDFYMTWHDNMPISWCTCSDKKWKPNQEQKLPLYLELDELDKSKHYVLIATSEYACDVSAVLLQIGYRIIQDYMYFDVFEAAWNKVFSDTSLTVAIGRCGVLTVVDVMKNNVPDGYNSMISIWEDRIIENSREHIDCFLVTQVQWLIEMSDFILTEDLRFDFLRKKKYENLVRDHGKNSRWIQISLFQYRGPFFQSNSHVAFFFLKSIDRKVDVALHRDLYVESLIEQGYSSREILDKVSGEDTFPREKIVEYNLSCLKTANSYKRDEEIIDITDLYESEYRKQKIFFDYVHMMPGSILHKHLAFRLYTKMNRYTRQPQMVLQSFSNLECTEVYDEVEVPIYPSVANALELDYYEDYKYRWGTSKNCERLPFKEFMEREIDLYFWLKTGALLMPWSIPDDARFMTY